MQFFFDLRLQFVKNVLLLGQVPFQIEWIGEWLRRPESLFLLSTLHCPSFLRNTSNDVRMQYYSKHEFQRKYHFMNFIFLQDRKKNFEKQQSKMKKRNSSFLDSIRMEVENEEEFWGFFLQESSVKRRLYTRAG